jgi:hypothetical protein
VKILIDGDSFAVSGRVDELLAITGLAQDGIKQRRRVDGGASRYAVSITRELIGAAERGLIEMSHARHENATPPADEPESLSDSRSRAISISEAAEHYKVDPRTILRWKNRDPSMIASERPYRLDPIAVEAYASSRPRSRRAAA